MVDVVRVHVVQRRHEVGQRPDDPQRVAVGDHDACVGVGREEEGQGGKVRGRLDDPARRRPLGHPLQRLQMALVPVVNRGLVLAAAPHRVLGHVVEAGVHVARELVGEGEDALGGEPAAVLVHGGEGGHHLVHERDLVVAQVARGVVVGDGVQQLPQQRRPVVGVAGQQLVQQRGARAPEAGHDDGRVRPARAGRPAPSSRGRPCAAGSAGSAGSRRGCGCGRAGGGAPRCRARRRGARKGSSHHVSPKSSSPVVAIAAACRSSGCERDHRAPVVAEAVSERDHLVGPGAARRGGPGHGASPYPQRGRTDASTTATERRTATGNEAPAPRSEMSRERGRVRPERRRDPRRAGDGGRAARSRPARRSRSSTTRCRRRRSSATCTPATPSWRWRAWCTTSATCCRAARDEAHADDRGPGGAAGAGGAGGGNGRPARGGEAVSRGDRGRLRRCARRRQRGRRWAARAAP